MTFFFHVCLVLVGPAPVLLSPISWPAVAFHPQFSPFTNCIHEFITSLPLSLEVSFPYLAVGLLTVS